MQYLVIRNAGEIEPGALSLMGASTKDSEEHIGKFGSGFKYAIATLLRVEEASGVVRRGLRMGGLD